ncbi:non-hydrolyzing UDP-N-acetylglucosamine 2-epimerase [Lysobacter yangpyeongensis]|uniref:UDP-N-acetylglucosamine 2-epimerase (non-hydrolyzing) n=1 Tax=Lysobacter yangpyeongensis TaxID=346182 RepID=A0ABW0SKF3_9GAMM
MPDARLVAAGSVALTVTLVAIFSLRPLAPRVGLVDRPDMRKRHRGRVPLIGGLCFFTGLVAGLSYLGFLDRFTVSLLVAGAVIMLTGLLDDLFDLSVRARLAIQFCAAIGVIAVTGVYLDSLGHLGSHELRLHLVGIPLTVFAVVGLMNAFNMLDGIDGLAGGLTMVSILAVLAFTTGTGWQALGVLLLLQVLLAAMIPYLGVNLGWPDGRKIFMGDAGSTVIGFLLAWSLIYLSQRHVGRMEPADVLWCVAIPIMDTLAVIVRRLRAGRSPFRPDRQHLHHLLLDAGYSPRLALVVIVGAGGLLAGIGYALREVPDLLDMAVFAGLLALYVLKLPDALRWLGDAGRGESAVGEAVAAALDGEAARALDAIEGLPATGAHPGKVRTLCVLGESQDAIRIAPVASKLCHDTRFATHVCVTDLASEKQRRILELFDLKADFDLGIASPQADPSEITSATLDGIKRVLLELRPDVVLVHGDTPATLAATLAACYQQIPVARLESAAEAMHLPSRTAGGEVNRRVASALASFHFTSCESDSDELVAAGIPRDRIQVTGDTAIDTLRTAIERIGNDRETERALRERFAFLRPDSPLLLVTHREQIDGFAQLGRALRKVARMRPDVDIVYPIALTPDAQRDTQKLGWRPPNVHLVEPLDYLAFAWLMQRAHVVLTGSAEVESEAALLSKPILVLRDAGVDANDPRQLAVDDAAISAGVMALFSDRDAYEALRVAYNEGDAAPSYRIVDALASVPPRSSALAA